MFASLKPKGITAALAAAAALITAAPAFAAPFASNGRTAEVRFADLDLTKSDDRSELNRRLYRAATRVCSSMDFREVTRCREGALRNIKQPVRAALARAETRARYAEASGNAKVIVGN